ERLSAAIPLARLFLAQGGARLKDLATETLLQVTVDEHQDRVLEFFDKYNLLVFLAVLGPGFITANVDNDAGGIYTYSAAGARYGYLPLWTLVPITLA